MLLQSALLICQETFANAYIFNGAIGNWDVSGVNNMTGMFASATAFNQAI
jgi:hypothetical protein